MFKKISWKVITPGIAIIIIFILLILLWMMPNHRSAIYDEKKLKIKQITSVGYSIIAHYYKLFQDGTISESDAKENAKAAVKSMRYGPENKDYLWINDFQPVMVAHPYRSDLEGQNVADFKDPEGTKLFIEFINVCDENGEGFVEYIWQWKDNKDRLEKKVSYVKEFKPWKWIIGTGIYVNDVAEIVNERLIIYIIVLFILSVIFIFVIVMISKSITVPVKKSIDFAIAVSNGDLTQKIKIKSKDEILELANALNEMVVQLADMVNNINDVASNLTASSEEINSSAESLSNGAQTQAANVEETNSAVSELKSTIEKINKSIVDINSKSQNAINKANESQDKVNAAISSMKKTAESSQQIQEIITVINDIADQTNLLSLNASIEAARAGEHGRGFSVVADEISKLSDRSAESTKEIEQLIKQSITDVNNSVNLVNETSLAFNEISEGVVDSGNLIEEITNSVNQQDEGMSQVAGAIEQINDIAQSTSASAEQLSASTVELKNQAERLNDLINQFKISEQLIKEHIESSKKSIVPTS